MAVVGFLFPGEMGAAIGAAARGDVIWASEGRSETTAERAAAAGLRDAGTVAELVAASDIVFSICPPAIADQVAEEVAALGFTGLYVEGNAIAPTRAERIAEVVTRGGARMVDGAVIGDLHLYLSGDTGDVQEITGLFAGTAVTAIPLDGAVGSASALKMAYGGWNKIGIALAAQAYAIARAYGVEAALAAEGVDAERFVRSAPRAWRWAPEMEEVAATCEELGLPGGIGLGAAELYRRWDRHRDRPAELDSLLRDLRDA